MVPAAVETEVEVSRDIPNLPPTQKFYSIVKPLYNQLQYGHKTIELTNPNANTSTISHGTLSGNFKTLPPGPAKHIHFTSVEQPTFVSSNPDKG